MGDIVERLRRTKRRNGDVLGDLGIARDLVNPDGPEAATTISNLQAENAKLREALKTTSAAIQIERDHLFSCCTVSDDPATLDNDAKPDIDRMDAALSLARQALEAHHGQ